VLYIAVDYDGTIVRDDRPYDDVTTPPIFMPGAKTALHSLKRAGHKILLWSARSSPALIIDPKLDPLVKAGIKPENRLEWERRKHIHVARHEHMLAFVAEQLPGVFDAIDDGHGGKPLVHLFIDDKALRMTRSGWLDVARTYGEPLTPMPLPRLGPPPISPRRLARLLSPRKKGDDNDTER